MKNEVRYKDYRIGRDVYTVKLTYLPNGGFHYNPVVRVQVMEWHLPPRNLWERITEWWKYDISDYQWDPLSVGTSLDTYCINKCDIETKSRAIMRAAVERGETEWEAL